jgi:hypothetical protein
LDASREARKGRKSFIETELELVNADLEKSQTEWIEERKVLHEKIKQKDDEYEKLKEDRDKLLDQVSDVGIKNYRRSQERIKEKAEASRIAEENAALRKAAEHIDGVDRAIESNKASGLT